MKEYIGFDDCNCKIPITENGPHIDYHNLNFDCPKIWRIYRDGQTQSIFQLEKYLGKTWSRKYIPTTVDEISDLISAIRPGAGDAKDDQGRSMTEVYAIVKSGEEEATYLHESLEPVLSPTFGVLIYQEQILQIARDLAGFDLNEADLLRKAVGKKDAKKMAEAKNLFIEKAKSHGVIDEDTAHKIFEVIEKSAKYSFNKSHGVLYAYIGLHTAFVKAHLPKEYLCAWLRYASNSQDPLEEYSLVISEANKLGVVVRGPSIKNLPRTDFFIDNEDIYFGIGSIKGCGDNSFEKIENLDEIDFVNMGWIEFLVKYAFKINKTQIIAMIQSGCFDYMNIERAEAEFNYNILVKKRGGCKFSATQLQFMADNLEKTLKDTILSLKNMPKISKNKIGEVDEIVKLLDDPPYSLTDSVDSIIKNEKELLGINISCRKINYGSIPSNIDSCSDVNTGKPNEEFTLAGEIIGAYEFKIKKEGPNQGKTMMRFTFVDDKDSCDCVCFPRDLDHLYTSLYTGNVCVVKGKLGDRGGLIVKKAYDI